jgi:hypothetical protein
MTDRDDSSSTAPSSPTPAGWLEVHDGEHGEHAVDCPKRGSLARATCFACADSEGPALDPSGKHVYVVCTCAGAGGGAR